MSNEQVETFNKDDIAINVTRSPNCVVEFSINMGTDTTKKEYEKALKEINKQVSLPGFRKGKAPRNIILTKFKDHIDEEWRKGVLNSGFRTAMETTDIHPISEKTIKAPKVESITLEEGAKYSISFESTPVIPELNIDSLSLEKKEYAQASDEQVDKEIQEFLNRHQSMERAPESTQLDATHSIDIDVDILDAPAHNLYTNQRVDLSQSSLKWLQDALAGQKVDSSIDIDLPSEVEPSCPLNLGEDAGKKARVSLKAIYAQTKPELTDELCQKEGYATVEELRTAIKGWISRKNEEDVRKEYRNSLKEQILSSNSVEIPLSLLAEEESKQLRFVTQSEETKDLDKDAAREEATRRATETLSLIYILRNLVTEENVQVMEGELIHATMADYLYENDHFVIDPTSNHEALRMRLYFKVMVKKALDLITDRLVPPPVKEETQESEQEASSESAS